MNNVIDCKQTIEEVSGDLYIRPVHLNTRGQMIPGHTHNFDHTTFLAQGIIMVEYINEDGETFQKYEMIAPYYFLTDANTRHQITALTDDVVFWCVFVRRDDEGNITTENDAFDATL